MMNKGVFGTAYFVRNLLGSNNNNELQKSKGGSNNNKNGAATLYHLCFSVCPIIINWFNC